MSNFYQQGSQGDYDRSSQSRTAYEEPDNSLNVTVSPQCPYCHREIAPNSNFCPFCAHSLVQPQGMERSAPQSGQQTYQQSKVDLTKPGHAPQFYPKNDSSGYGEGFSVKQTDGFFDDTQAPQNVTPPPYAQGFDPNMAQGYGQPYGQQIPPQYGNPGYYGQPMMGGAPKNKWTYLILTILLGHLGAHNFYEGKIVKGLLWYIPVVLFILMIAGAIITGDDPSDAAAGIWALAFFANVIRHIVAIVLAVIKAANTNGDTYYLN